VYVYKNTHHRYTEQVNRLAKLIQVNANELASLKMLFQKSKSEIYAYRRIFATQNLQFMHDFSFHHLDMMNSSSEHMNKVDAFIDKKQSETGDALSRLQSLDKVDLKTGKKRKSTRGRGGLGRGRGGITRESVFEDTTEKK